ncbi:hypothetical protein FD951_12125 [Pseudomonas chlororaphis subsp. aurantiaca]|nr:hypothetical protein FD951_12125 [Pseudomonas chlororaphis subsp. aurantiaca]
MHVLMAGGLVLLLVFILFGWLTAWAWYWRSLIKGGSKLSSPRTVILIIFKYVLNTWAGAKRHDRGRSD